MEKRKLGKNLEVSGIGLGCMGFTHAYGPAMDEKEAAKAIREAFDHGYTFFDTAECYVGNREDGSLAFNEDLVGEALEPIRDQVIIATKGGVAHSSNGLITDSKPETLRKSVEGSLNRLKTDHIDLYYQHRIDPKVEPEEVAKVMGDLIKEGKILNWGISETDEEYLRRAHAVTPVSAVQNRLSMMARWHENLFPTLEELDIGFVAFSPLANGILSDAFRAGMQFDKDDYRNRIPQYVEEAFRANQELLEMIRNLAESKEATPAQISLAWILGKKPYIVPIPGSRKIERIKENFDAGEIKLSEEEVKAIDEKLDQIPTSEVFGGSVIKE